MIFLRFFTSKLGLYALAVLAVVGFVLWLRWDAVQDEREKAQRRANEARIEHIDDARARRNEIQNLDNDSLLDRLIKRVSPGDE